MSKVQICEAVITSCLQYPDFDNEQAFTRSQNLTYEQAENICRQQICDKT